MMPPVTDMQPDAGALRQVFLDQGRLFYSRDPSIVRTVLGSCVAVCLIDRHGRAGGMNHYVLPVSNDGSASPRYGDAAIARLILAMNRLGCDCDDLQAKIFGGAAVLPYGSSEDTVGDRNVAIAEALLHSYGIPITARCTGGDAGMIVRLHTTTGDVIVRYLAKATETTEYALT